MAVWTNFAALIASLASGKAFTDEKAQALAENTKAAFEGDATAVADGVTLKDPALDTGAATAAGIAWVGLRTAGLAAGAVGSYMFANNGVNAVAFGGTIAGSNLQPANSDGNLSAGAQAGTWRCMGRTTSGGTVGERTSLFVRIS